MEWYEAMDESIHCPDCGLPSWALKITIQPHFIMARKFNEGEGNQATFPVQQIPTGVENRELKCSNCGLEHIVIYDSQAPEKSFVTVSLKRLMVVK